MTPREAKAVKARDFARLDPIADRVLASRRRSSAKKAPGRAEDKAKRQARAFRVADIRADVFLRAHGNCECCRQFKASEMHHVLGGADRRRRESVETCIALCAGCHSYAHSGNLWALHKLRDWAQSYGYAEAEAAILRRIDKVLEARSA